MPVAKQTDPQVEDLVEWLRRGMKLGPVMLVAELAEFGITLAVSMTHRILLRRGISRLRDLDVTGETMRQVPHRYEYPVAGDMVHVDVKKIGRIPDGGGWRVHGRGTDEHRASQRRPRPGYAFLHTAIDDRSRLAYTEELTDEKSVTAAGFWVRAVAFFAAHGIERIDRVLTDNGSCYRGRAFNQALGATVHKFTKPYRPEAKGLVERLHDYLEKSFLPGREFTSPADFNAQLGSWLTRANHRLYRTLGCRPADRVEGDRSAMLALPPVPPSTGWRSSTRLPRDHYVRVDGNDYSVHPSVIGRRIEVTADLHRVRVWCDGKPVADHERVWAKHQTLSDPDHVAAAKALRKERFDVVGRTGEPEVEQRRLTDYDDALGVTDEGVA